MNKFEYWSLEARQFVELSEVEIARIMDEYRPSTATVEDIFSLALNEDKLLPLDSLIPTRARAEGIINASTRMQEAKEGRREKRSPLSIRYEADLQSFVVLDGNSTFFICQLWGLKKVPCHVQE